MIKKKNLITSIKHKIGYLKTKKLNSYKKYV